MNREQDLIVEAAYGWSQPGAPHGLWTIDRDL